jgi:uncharacterized protein (UPF0261 family)
MARQTSVLASSSEYKSPMKWWRWPSRGPTAVLVPRLGVSAIDKEGQPSWWPAADQALFASLRLWMSPHVELIELDLHINDPAVAEAAACTLLRLMGKK